jgi:hypothetical protein
LTKAPVSSINSLIGRKGQRKGGTILFEEWGWQSAVVIAIIVGITICALIFGKPPKSKEKK